MNSLSLSIGFIAGVLVASAAWIKVFISRWPEKSPIPDKEEP